MINFIQKRLQKIFVLFFGLIYSTIALAQPTAKFTANSVKGCVPADIQFVDQSTGNPTSWNWDFGDGTTSTLKNPLKTYTASGNFSVTLTVSNSLGSATSLLANYIIISPAPIVNFSASTQKGCFPVSTNFTDMSITGSGNNIVSWIWTFGDGGASTTQNPSYKYSTIGSYDVSLSVQNNIGCSATLNKTAYIQVGDTVARGFDTATLSVCTLPKTVQFTSPYSTSPLTYTWDFGDGATSTQANPTHNFNAGIFTVKLTAQSSFGCSVTTTKVNLIRVDTMSTDFSLPTLPCVGSALVFPNLSVPSSVNSFWSFGDGTNVNAFSPIKTYNIAGNYNVTLTNIFANGCTASVTKTLNVLAKPAISFSANAITGCKPPLKVFFTSTTTGANSLNWDFGDGFTGTGTTVTHTYNTSGIFSVKLIAGNANGCKDSLIKANYINLYAPTASIGIASTDGCLPFSINPTTNVNAADGVSSYSWDFGDGIKSTSASPTHTYTALGSYNLSLTITTNGGCSTTTSQTIRVGTPPLEGYNIFPIPVCADQPVNFIDSSKLGNISFWDFGDGNTSNSSNVLHIYKAPGVYTVKFTVDYSGCKKNIVLDSIVTVLPPVASFSFSQFCSDPGKFSFNSDSSVGVIKYAWNFGDGTTDSIANPIHSFPDTGSYTVKLIVTNQTCNDTTSKKITISKLPTSFTASSTTFCYNNSATFTAFYNTPAYVTAYVWDFGDGTTISTVNNIVTHTYTTSGVFSVKLIVQNSFTCVDTVYKQNLMHVNGPKAAFLVLNPTGCNQRLVTFNDSSKTDGRNAITNWQWNFGDGTSQTYTAPPFTHVYPLNGSYNVKLVETDVSGCKDSIQISPAVITSRPSVSFSSLDTFSCPNAIVKLYPDSTDLNAVYNWDYGTGKTTGDTAFVSYSDSGLYTIKMIVKDANNCIDSSSIKNYITIKKPIALFTPSDSASICAPLKITFTNKSYYFSSLQWDFSNGTFSIQPNPYISFGVGSYNVKLKVTSPGGCTDSLTKPIVVYPATHTFSYTPTVGCQPLTTIFHLSTPTYGTYVWDFNDGTTLATTDSSTSKTYTTFGPYLPRVTFKENTGCSIAFVGADTITVVGAKANFGLSAKTICGSGTEFFTDSSVATDPITYFWDFGDGSSSNLQDPNYVYKIPGTYSPKLIVRTSNCADTLLKPNAIIVYIKPDAIISGDSLGCAPFTATFSSSIILPDTSAIKYSWDFGNGQTATLAEPLPITYTIGGNYVVKLHTTSANGCTADTSKNILVNFVPKLNAGNDTAVCFGIKVALNASGANSYKWLPPTNNQLSCINCANPIATLTNPVNIFVVQDTTVTGCEVKDSVIVKYLVPYAVSVIPITDSLCIGQSLQFFASGAQLYSWSPASAFNNPTISNPIVTPTASTTYTLSATDTLGCQSFTQTVPVTVFQYPTVNAGADVTISAGSSTQLSPTASADVVNYRWTPPLQLSCSYCESPTATPKTTTTYTVTASNVIGCSATDEVTITILCSNNNVFIPNTFSPNGDGVNDIFFPRGTGLFSIKSFRVFNRWGNLMFARTNMTPNDASQGWDGKYNGKLVMADVYTYMAEVYCENNTLLTINGNVTVVY